MQEGIVYLSIHDVFGSLSTNNEDYIVPFTRDDVKTSTLSFHDSVAVLCPPLSTIWIVMGESRENFMKRYKLKLSSTIIDHPRILKWENSFHFHELIEGKDYFVSTQDIFLGFDYESLNENKIYEHFFLGIKSNSYFKETISVEESKDLEKFVSLTKWKHNLWTSEQHKWFEKKSKPKIAGNDHYYVESDFSHTFLDWYEYAKNRFNLLCAFTPLHSTLIISIVLNYNMKAYANEEYVVKNKAEGFFLESYASLCCTRYNPTLDRTLDCIVEVGVEETFKPAITLLNKRIRKYAPMIIPVILNKSKSRKRKREKRNQ
jgi:hypothetical protein